VKDYIVPQDKQEASTTDPRLKNPNANIGTSSSGGEEDEIPF